jgi:ankyrin repeat protein
MSDLPFHALLIHFLKDLQTTERSTNPSSDPLLVVDKVSSIHCANARGETALCLCARNGHMDVAASLLKVGPYRTYEPLTIAFFDEY